MGFYDDLGVRTVINAAGTLTRLGGSRLAPEVLAAMAEASASFVHIDELQAKRDRLVAGLAEAGFTALRPAGTYFVQADIRPLGFTDGVDLCRRLPELAGVVAIPTQVFYDDAAAGRHFVRFAFCKRDEVIDEAVRRLARLGGAGRTGAC